MTTIQLVIAVVGFSIIIFLACLGANYLGRELAIWQASKRKRGSK